MYFFIFQKKSKKKWAYALIYVKHHSWWCDQHVYINTKRKAPWYFKDGARGRNRTDTPITGPRILSPVRLPVSPLEHKMVTCKELESLTPWLKVKCSTSWANRSNINGWDNWDRTSECQNQNLVPYRLAISHPYLWDGGRGRIRTAEP